MGPGEKETDKPIYYYRENNLKIIYRESDDSWEMYDLEKDPRELNNIINISSKAEKMMEKLKPRIRRWERRT